MKRVLVLNVDSFVGKEVCRRFYEAKEYLIDGTLYHQSDSMTKTETLPESNYNSLTASKCLSTNHNLTGSPVPQGLQPFLNAVIPRHGEISDEQFRARVLTYDIIIAVLEDDAFEADCTIRILRGTHYEVEKTFVLVSNVFTWAQTDAYEHELRRAEIRAEREAARANNQDDDDNDGYAVEEEEEEEEEEVMEKKVWSEEDYHKRYPDVRYSMWKELEHMVKHANSETLHTYVLWAGLPYGGGEDLLASYFYKAWYHKKILQYGDGLNCVPTIHVYDLSRIIFLVGSSYDTLEERYMFAVDQGNNTQAEILQGIKDFIGGVVEIGPPKIDLKHQVTISTKENGTNATDLSASFFDAFGGSSVLRMRRNLMELHEKIDGNDNNDEVDDSVKKGVSLVASLAEREMLLQSRLAKSSKHDYDSDSYNMTAYERGLVVASPHGLANWFSAVDVRCVPGAVLSLLSEEEWVSFGGLFANIDKVVQEFKKKRQLEPMRIVLAGPPCSMKETVARRLAEMFSIPYLTVENVISAYEAYVAKIRAEMVDIFVRRRLRRHEAREERRRCAEERARLERKEAEVNEEEEEEEEEEDEEKEPGTEEDEGSEEEKEEGVTIDELKQETKKHEVSVTIEERIRQNITEAELLRPSESEEDEDEEDEDWEGSGDDEGMNDKAAAIKRQINETERRRIATLREEYRFATQLLTLHLVNGEFPLRPKSSDYYEEGEEEEGEEEEEGDDDSEVRRSKKKNPSPPTATDEPPPIIRYLDEAIAVMVRWRLQQDDCRNQGYILESFPTTVRQASLLFMAETDEQKEMQRPKLQREREEAGPQVPYDANFPLPEINKLDDDKRREMLDLMKGKIFLSAEEVLAPTHEVFFPDCFIFLTGSEALIRSRMSAVGGGEENIEASSDFYKEFTDYLTHHNPSGEPAESLLTWFQTVVVGNSDNDAEKSDFLDGDGVSVSASRKACVLFMPIPAASPHFIMTRAGSDNEDTQFEEYCSFIRWSVLQNQGFGSCGPLIDVMRANEEAELRRQREIRFEWMVLDKLRATEELFLASAKKIEASALEEERRVLRFYELWEAYASLAGVDNVPADMYLRQYVLPSLIPLMAEVVRMRPEDPVTVLADALFHYKRQVTL